MRGPKQSFAIYDNDQLTKAAPYNDLIIAYRNGAPVRIRDIGQAVDGPADTTLAAWINGRRAIALIVSKQPGANVIDTVDRIKAELPRLTANIPPSVEVTPVIDRTTTIRASVRDVQFTLVLTMGLVVMVIFVFLRNLRSTIIPGLAVPLSIVGTFAVMYALGYSLDNLSLMGLTIAVGFVVDDAIVVLENIERHLEEGLPPYRGCPEGRRRDRLYGPLDQPVARRRVHPAPVHERHRGTTPTRVCGDGDGGDPGLGRGLADADTHARQPVLETEAPLCGAGPLLPASERAFEALLGGYGRTLDVVLRHPGLTLLGFAATLAATGWLFLAIPKGFFPIQDTGFILGQTEAAADVSPAEMARLQQELAGVVASDPDVAQVVSVMGGARTVNQGLIYASLKPLDEGRTSAMEIVNRLRPKLARVRGREPHHATGAGHHHRRSAIERACSSTRSRMRSSTN